jgi:hypothetical protein
MAAMLEKEPSLTKSTVDQTTLVVKRFTQSRRNMLAFIIGVSCIIIVFGSLILFYFGNQEHDGWANIIMSIMSYSTTSFALVVALMFLDFN